MAEFLEEEWVTSIPRLRTVAAWSGFSARRTTKQAVYNPPPGWVVVENRVQVHSSNNGSRSVSALAGGLDLLAVEDAQEVFDAALEAAGKLGGGAPAKKATAKKAPAKKAAASDKNPPEVVTTQEKAKSPSPETPADDKGNDLVIKLRQRQKDQIREILRFKTSHNTVLAKVSARAHGSAINRKRGWEEISVRTRIRYIGGPDQDDLVADLEEEFDFDIPF